MGIFGKEKENSDAKPKKALSEKEMQDKSYLHVRAIIEMLGKPKDHLELTFGDFMDQLSKVKGITITKKTYSKTKKQGDLYSRFAEIELWAESLSNVIGLCFDYMPSSIEIISPERITYPIHQLNGYLNELQAKLHHVDMLAKQAQTEKSIISSNFFKLVENSILLCTATGAKTINEISTLTGMDESSLQAPIKSLLEHKKLKQDGEKYVLIR